MESPPTPRSWTAPATLPMHPGKGLAEHPFLYAGEGFNTIFLVADGKMIWSYASAPGGEIDDVWMLSNAHILYAHSNFLEELTPKKLRELVAAALAHARDYGEPLPAPVPVMRRRRCATCPWR